MCDQQLWWISSSVKVVVQSLHFMDFLLICRQTNKWGIIQFRYNVAEMYQTCCMNARLSLSFIYKPFAGMWKQSIMASDKSGVCKGGQSTRQRRRRNRPHKVRIQCLHPQGSSWARRAAEGEKKNIKRRPWTLTFLPWRKFRAVPTLATQWILFSFFPGSHGWKEKEQRRWGERNSEKD